MIASTGPKISSRATVMLGRHVAEHGRPDVIAAVQARRAAGSAGDQPGAFLDAGLDEALDLVELDPADDRPEIDARARGDRRPSGRRRPLRRSPAPLAGARPGTSMRVGASQDWPLLAKQASDARAHRGLEIRVGQDDVRRLAAEFLRDALDRVGGRLGDDDPGAGRAGEGHHVDVGMGRP